MKSYASLLESMDSTGEQCQRSNLAKIRPYSRVAGSRSFPRYYARLVVRTLQGQYGQCCIW